MPRKSTDHAQEQRVTLGNFERGLAEKKIQADNYRSIALGVAGSGTLIAGVGAFVAGWAFMKFKAPDVIEDVKGFVFNSLDSAADIILPGNPVELRRQAQALAKERARLASAEAVYCTFSSEKYDAAECSNVFLEKDAYAQALVDFQERVRALYGVGGKYGNENRRNDTYWSLIFGGLGDIDPNLDNNPNNNEP